MTRNALIPYPTARPFTPFSVTMADGSRHEVRHPERIAIGRAGCLIDLADDSWVQLDIRRMTEVGPIPAAETNRQ